MLMLCTDIGLQRVLQRVSVSLSDRCQKVSFVNCVLIWILNYSQGLDFFAAEQNLITDVLSAGWHNHFPPCSQFYTHFNLKKNGIAKSANQGWNGLDFNWKYWNCTLKLAQWSGSASCVLQLQILGDNYFGTILYCIANIQECPPCHVSMTVAFVLFHHLKRWKLICQDLIMIHVE